MSTVDQQVVAMSIPSDVRFFRPVRLAIGGLATLVGFDVEAIDDLRMGVDELCAALADCGDGTPITIEVTADAGLLLRIDGYAPRGSADIDQDRFGFSRQILSVVSDDYGFDLDGDRVHCWLERAPLAPEASSDQV